MSQPHPRDLATDAAGREFIQWASAWRQKYALTGVEALYILNRVSTLLLQELGTEEREKLVKEEQEWTGT